MRNSLRRLLIAAVLPTIWACSDFDTPDLITDVSPLQSHIPACDVRDVLDAARRYLKSPQVQQATTKIREIQSAGCVGEANERLAWEVLGIVEFAFYNALGGSGSDGARLANGLLHCCIPLGNGVMVDERSLARGGAFGVRGLLSDAAPHLVSNTDPVLSRDPIRISFTSEDGHSLTRPAIFAVRPQAPALWQDVAFGAAQNGTFIDDLTLINGLPLGSAESYRAFEFNEAPDLGFQPGTQVDVIICFTDLGQNPPGDPHAPGGGAFAARMKRNTILLQKVEGVEQFCQEWVWDDLAMETPASPSRGSLLALVDRFLFPQPLFAALTDTRSTAFGGSAYAFSEFSPSNAMTRGSLTFVQSPPPVVGSRSSTFPLAVQAKSGGGAPMEHVEIRFLLKTNLGVPGAIVGSFIDCSGSTRSDAVACTEEPDGIASTTISISKAGGYTLCAVGLAAGFEFPETCTEQFHVRN